MSPAIRARSSATASSLTRSSSRWASSFFRRASSRADAMPSANAPKSTIDDACPTAFVHVRSSTVIIVTKRTVM